MRDFVLKNSDRYSLPGTHGRFLHLATVQRNTQEYFCFQDLKTQKTYIEEVTLAGNLEFISDDNLVQDIARFLEYKGITLIKKGDEIREIKI